MNFIYKILFSVSLLFFPASIAASNDSFTVVIDAGHGGKDTGAIDNNVKEKDVNLGVALKLGELIRKKLKDTKVVYTRDNDTYLTLQERADKANKAKGNLFISIHTNSVDKSNKNRTTISGASVYALGLHKDTNNMAVARRENSVIELEKNFEQKYSGFDPSKDESYILFEMAQKKNLSQSIRFANEVQKQLVSTAARRDRGVHQAGFWVLWATSMPAVLVELDFICNPNSAKYIASEQGQQQMAQAIFNAVEKYSKSYKSYGNTRAISDVSLSDEITDEIAPSDDSAAILASASSNQTRKSHVYSGVNGISDRSAYASARRRRRSDASRTASMNRDLSTTAIEIPKNTAPENTLVQITEKNVVRSGAQAAKQIKDNVSRKAKKTSRENTTHRGKIEKLINTYKIQILASAEKIKDNSPRFLGLSPVRMFRENNLYKYTYGESQSKSEIEKLLNEVKKLFPDAFLIKSISTRK